MGQQIIRQPDGHFAVFSSLTDTIIVWDATADEVVEWFAERAADDARRATRDKIEKVAAGDARAYFQFTMTWERALAMDYEHGGTVAAEYAEQAP